MDVEEEDRLTMWLGDAEAAEARVRVGTVRAVFTYTLRVFSDQAGGCQAGGRKWRTECGT